MSIWAQDMTSESLEKRIEALENAKMQERDEEIERLRDELHRIVQWSEAYPIDIFPEPDLKKARELLAAGGITLDAVAAHCMRHAIEGIGKFAKEALKEKPE